jgi:putative PIN family toxin of toxin-antitoxin system
VRAVLDPNILISALLSRCGAPAEILARWLAGEFELIVSELLLKELERALSYPKLRRRIAPGDAAAFVTLLRKSAAVAADPEIAPRRSPDSGDDYLLALAEAERAVVVTGDAHLLGLPDRFPIFSARGFVDALKHL